MNDLDLCLEVVSRSRQPLRYIWRWISRKPLEMEVWFQRTTNRKWHMGYRMVTWPMTSRDLERSNAWPHYAYSAITRKLLELETSNLVCSFVSGMPRGRTNNFPESGRGLGHVTATILGYTVGYPSVSLASCFPIHDKERSVVWPHMQHFFPSNSKEVWCELGDGPPYDGNSISHCALLSVYVFYKWKKTNWCEMDDSEWLIHN